MMKTLFLLIAVSLSDASTRIAQEFYVTARIETTPLDREYPRVMFLMENGKCWKYRWIADRASPTWQLSGLADYCGSCGRQYSNDIIVHGQCVPNNTAGTLLNIRN